MERDLDKMALLGMAMSTGMFRMSPRQMDAIALGELRRKYLGMCGKNDSPWKVYAKLIDAGKVYLRSRPNRPPLLIIRTGKKRYAP
jgi:hypothetical protein